jgi:competence protein ComEC
VTLLASAIAWLLSAAAFNLGWSPWSALAVAPAATLCLPAGSCRLRLVHGIAGVAVVTVAAMALRGPAPPLPPDSIGHHLNEPVTLLARANGDGDRHPSYVALTASALARDDRGEWRPASGRLTAFLPASAVVHDGDELQIAGTLSSPGGVGAPPGYRDWLSRRGVVAGMSDPRLRIVAASGSAGPLTAFRDRIRAGLTATLPGREGALAFALLFGGRHALPPDLNDDLVRSGTAHLAVVSAFNLALLFGAVLALATPLLGRRRAAPLALAAALAYGALAGAGPSVVRGEILIALMTLSLVSGRPHSRAALLLVAAAAMTLPDARLLTDVSFQLTFAAAAGAALLTAPIRRLMLRLLRLGEQTAVDAAAPMRIGLSAVAFSVAVSVACLPVLATAFGSLPTYGVLINGLISPFVPALMALAFATGVLGSLLLPIARLAAAPLWLGLKALEWGIHVGARMPGADISLPVNGFAIGCAWYAALAAIYLAETRWPWHGGADPRRPARRRHGGRCPSFAAGRPVLAGVVFALTVVAAPTSVLAARRLATSGQPRHAVVRWRETSLGAVQEVEGANGGRVLLVDGSAPSILAAVRASGGLGDRAIDAVVVARSDARYADPTIWRESARSAHAGNVFFVAAAPGGSSEPASAEAGLLLIRGRASIELGGGDRIDLLTDGQGAATVRVVIDGRFAILAGTVDAHRLFELWHENGLADLVVLPGVSSDKERQAIADLSPSLALLSGRSGLSAPGSLKLLRTAETRELRISANGGHLTVSYRDR